MTKLKGADLYEALLVFTDKTLRPNNFLKYIYGIKISNNHFLDLIDLEVYPIINIDDIAPDFGEYACSLVRVSNVNKNRVYSYNELIDKASEAKNLLQMQRDINSKTHCATEIRRELNK